MIFTLLLGLTLLDGSVVYQKYQQLESPSECREIAIVVGKQYFDEGILDKLEIVCYGGYEA